MIISTVATVYQKPDSEVVVLYPGDVIDPTLSTWYPPPLAQPIPPSIVTMRQARLALFNAGLLTSVNNAIAAMTGTAGDASRIEWEFAATVDRNSSLVSNLSATLGLTALQLDALFTAAAAI